MTWNAYFLLVLLTYLSYVGPEAKLAGAGKSSSLHCLDIFISQGLESRRLNPRNLKRPLNIFESLGTISRLFRPPITRCLESHC